MHYMLVCTCIGYGLSLRCKALLKGIITKVLPSHGLTQLQRYMFWILLRKVLSIQFRTPRCNQRCGSQA